MPINFIFTNAEILKKFFESNKNKWRKIYWFFKKILFIKIWLII